MMRRLTLLTMTMMLITLSATTAWGDPLRWSVGLRASHLNFTSQSWRYEELRLEMDPTMVYGLVASYAVKPYFALEATFERYDDADGDVRQVPTSQPNVSNIAQAFFTLSGKLLWPNQSRFKPYVSAGVGYFFNEFVREGYLTTVFSRMALEDSWGLLASVGTDFNITERWVLNLDVRYQWTEPEFQWRRHSDGRSDTEKFTLDGVMSTFAVKYLF